jgi:DNA-binding beta-propeller fold protein YncE
MHEWDQLRCCTKESEVEKMGDCKCGSTTTPGGICVECDIPQLARNNYFTGKLLVERDFTDEQRYYLGKLRRHNQRLHGWGTVCGLKVDQHPNPACQAQYVIIEPGTAIDCCGREILVQQEEYFDFESKFLSNWQVQNGPASQPDTAKHTIQICVSYAECISENVPAIFDDCSSGGNGCRPNRIVDGYSFDVIIDPKPDANSVSGVSLKWAGTINLANAVRVAVNSATNRLYVLTNPSSGAVVYAVDTTNGSILNSFAFGQDTALDVAVSPAGDFVYVTTQPPTPTAQPQPDPQIAVLKSDFSATISTLKVTNGAGQPVRSAVVPTPDDRLIAVSSKAGALIWATDVTSSNSPAAPATIAVGTSPVDVAVSAGGKYAYVANSGSNNVTAITLSTLAVTPVTVGSGSAVPAALAVAHTSAGDTLAVLDSTNDTLYFIGMRPDPASATALGSPVTGFANPAKGIRIADNGQWVYVEEQDGTGKGYVQAVNEHAVELNLTPILGAPTAAGVDPSGGMALSDDGTTLYLPYSGNSSGVSGAVAVVSIAQTDCSSIFDGAIDGCPDCDDGNCIVLASITGYVYQSAATTSMIDNLTDRHLLVSTDMLTEAVKCLMTQSPSSGVAGPQGPVGLQGPPGQNGQNGQPGQNGLNGAAGPAGPGLESGLTRIKGLSWVHGETGPPITLKITGEDAGSLSIALAFSAQIDITQIDPMYVLQVWVSETSPTNIPLSIQWTQLLGTIVPLTFASGDIDPSGKILHATKATSEPADGVAFVVQKVAAQFDHVKIVFLGDFVKDNTGKAISSEFVRAELPTGEIPSGSNIGLEGGIFVSWFTARQ